MKNIIVRLIWKFLGYGCCMPVHRHELNGILEKYQKNMNEQLSEQRAQLLEYFKQQEAAERADKREHVVSVRIVK